MTPLIHRGATLQTFASILAFALSLFAVSCSHAQEPAPFPNAPTVKRLDRSTIAAAEIDAIVNHAMQNAKVTGVGLAILNDRKIVFLKSYGQRDTSGDRWTNCHFNCRKLPLTPVTTFLFQANLQHRGMLPDCGRTPFAGKNFRLNL